MRQTRSSRRSPGSSRDSSLCSPRSLNSPGECCDGRTTHIMLTLYSLEIFVQVLRHHGADDRAAVAQHVRPGPDVQPQAQRGPEHGEDAGPLRQVRHGGWVIISLLGPLELSILRDLWSLFELFTSYLYPINTPIVLYSLVGF